jgi:hypothetical protein
LVLSVEPSLTITISLTITAFETDRITSLMVFSSLYAHIIAETFFIAMSLNYKPVPLQAEPIQNEF